MYYKKHPKYTSQSGLTIPEVLIIITIVFVIVIMILPATPLQDVRDAWAVKAT